MSLRRLQDVLKNWWCLTTKADVLTMSDRRCIDDIWRIYDVLKTSNLHRPIYDVLKTSDLWCFEDVWFTTFWRHRIYVVLKTCDLRRLEEVRFSSSWRHLIGDALKTSGLRRLEDICKTTSVYLRYGKVYATSKEVELMTNKVN